MHRNADGQSGERIVRIDGGGARSFVKTTRSRAFSLIGASCCSRRASDVSPLVSALPSNTAELEPHYEITLGDSARVAERAVQMLEIKPRDEFRYGYMLWLDRRDGDAVAVAAHRRARSRSSSRFCSPTSRCSADIPAAALDADDRYDGLHDLARVPNAAPLRPRFPGAQRRVPGRLQVVGRDAEPDRGLRDSRRASRLLRRSRDRVGVHRGPGDEGRGRRRLLDVGSTNAYSLTLARPQGHGDGRGPAANGTNDRLVAGRRVAEGRSISSHGCSAIGVVRASATGRVAVEFARPAALPGLRRCLPLVSRAAERAADARCRCELPVGATVDGPLAGPVRAARRGVRVWPAARRRCSLGGSPAAPRSAPTWLPRPVPASRAGARCSRRRRCAGGSSRRRCAPRRAARRVTRSHAQAHALQPPRVPPLRGARWRICCRCLRAAQRRDRRRRQQRGARAPLRPAHARARGRRASSFRAIRSIGSACGAISTRYSAKRAAPAAIPL